MGNLGSLLTNLGSKPSFEVKNGVEDDGYVS